MNNLISVTMGISDTSYNLRDGRVNIERNKFGDGFEDEPSETNIIFFYQKTYSKQHTKFKLFIRRATTQRFCMLFKQRYQIIDNKYFIYKANKNYEAKE
ncbi:hypothetical protein RS030_142248 [Cryptosporidium xiaoi]|uniref:Uncharacterized protein n=1 Tax=Cryptosporidium xiaoi TaxID=659607 RepID=A0AAV9Y2R4_9CRYT